MPEETEGTSKHRTKVISMFCFLLNLIFLELIADRNKHQDKLKTSKCVDIWFSLGLTLWSAWSEVRWWSPGRHCGCWEGKAWIHQRTSRCPPHIVHNSGSGPSGCSGWSDGSSCPGGQSCCMAPRKSAAHPRDTSRCCTDGPPAPSSWWEDGTTHNLTLIVVETDKHVHFRIFTHKTCLMSNFRWPGSRSRGFSRYFWITWTCPWLSM